MKLVLAVVILVLASSVAAAQAPCENPRTPPCQKACAMMGAKYVLAVRQQALEIEQMSRQPVSRPRVVLSSGGAGTWQMLENAKQLADLAGVPLQEVEAMTFQTLGAAVDKFCRLTPR